MSLAISLQSELLKSRRTASFYLTLVAAAVIPVIFIMDITLDGVSPQNRAGIVGKMFSEGLKMTGFLILPMFIILITTLLPQIEYKNQAWKQVLTSPQTKGNVFLAKFLNIHFLILIFIIVNQLMMGVAALVLNMVEPTWNVLSQPFDKYQHVVALLNSYAPLLAICTIQFWLGLRFKNFIAPIAIGISLWIIGSLLVIEFKSSIAEYFPYSFHVYGNFPQFKSKLNAVEWASGVYAIAFLVIAFLDFKSRKIKS